MMNHAQQHHSNEMPNYLSHFTPIYDEHQVWLGFTNANLPLPRPPVSSNNFKSLPRLEPGAEFCVFTRQRNTYSSVRHCDLYLNLLCLSPFSLFLGAV